MNDDFKSQLTALALDEVSAQERVAIEAVLAELPEARVYAAETEEFCELLTCSLAGSEGASLSDDQRAALVRQLTGESGGPALVVPSMPMPRRAGASWAVGLGAAAAAVLVASHLWREEQGDAVAMGPAGSVETRMVGDGLSGARGGAEGGAENVSAGGAGAASDPALANTAVGRLLNEGQGAFEVGDYGKAREAFNQVLATDPHNAAARRQLEWTERRAGEYLLAARDHTRTKMLREVDETWATAVPGAAVAPAEATSRGALAGTLAEDQKAKAMASREESRTLTGDALLAAAPKTKADAVKGGLRFGDNLISNNAIDGLMPADRDAGGVGAGEPAAAAVPAASASAAGAEPQPSLALTDLAKAPAEPDAVTGLAHAEDRAGRPLIARSDRGRSDALGLQSESEPRFRELQASTLSTADRQAESYAELPENPFLAVSSEPLSTFSIDVDTASYANVRRFLNQGQRPPKAAVRLEEMVNYFRYDYPQPVGDKPFSVTVDLTDCPWQPQHRLARIGLQGKTVAREQRPAANLVFLVDVSGSMDEPNKLPLVRQSLHLLTSQLKGSDHVALVTYAGQSGVALPSTSLEQKETVTRAIDGLAAGGSTNGASGLQLAYQQARRHFKAGGVNRVLLATDGDFNVGITDHAELEKLITDEARSGVFLSVLGYGMGNLKDATMEMLADKGNGNYAYIDSPSEARKALGQQLEGTLHAIAKDVKIQIEFNPAHVRNYRLLGYENRMLAKEDFNNDKKDAGEIGAGHSVTALYEIVPTSAPPIQPPVDPLKYQPGYSVAGSPPGYSVAGSPPAPAAAGAGAGAQPAAVDQHVSPESMTVKLRYKAPDGDTSQLLEVPVVDRKTPFAEAPADFKFAASVAMTGLLLKDSAHEGTSNWDMVRDLARAGKGPDPEGYRGEFLQLVEKAAGVAP